MKVKITRNLAKPFPPFKEGEIANVTDKGLLEQLMNAGLATTDDHAVASPATVGPEPKKKDEKKEEK